MKIHRIKRKCTRAAACLLAALISLSAFSAAAMAEELPGPVEPETAVEYISENEDSLTEELVFESPSDLKVPEAEEAAPEEETAKETDEADKNAAETDTDTISEAEHGKEDEPEDAYGLEDFDPESFAGIDFSSMRLIIAAEDAGNGKGLALANTRSTLVKNRCIQALAGIP